MKIDESAYILYKNYIIPDCWVVTYDTFIENKSQFTFYYKLLRKEKLKVIIHENR